MKRQWTARNPSSLTTFQRNASRLEAVADLLFSPTWNLKGMIEAGSRKLQQGKGVRGGKIVGDEILEDKDRWRRWIRLRSQRIVTRKGRIGGNPSQRGAKSRRR